MLPSRHVVYTGQSVPVRQQRPKPETWYQTPVKQFQIEYVPNVDTKPIAWGGAEVIVVIVTTEAMVSVANMYQETRNAAASRWGDVARY